MAASAAVTTGTVRSGGDESCPSVFELVSQHGFAHALRPAFLHILKNLAERYPEGYTLPMFYRHFDEVYLAFDSLVQWHYMVTRGASLSEAFYGLERRSNLFRSNGKFGSRIRLSFVLSVVLPYFKTKLDKLHQTESDEGVGMTLAAGNQNQNNTLNQSKMAFRQLFFKYYPYLKACFDLINFLCLFRYSFGHSKSHNLLFLMLGIRLTYASPSRAKFVEEKKSELFSPSSWSLRRLPILLLRSLGESVLFGVEMGSFFVQFLDWWYNDPRRERVILTSLPVPPPLSQSDNNFVSLTPQEMNLCPLCRRRFKNATALSTSGVVYCYGCISPYLKQHGRCPLTSVRSTMDHLIRIFA